VHDPLCVRMLPHHMQIKTDEGVCGDHVTDTQSRD